MKLKDIKSDKLLDELRNRGYVIIAWTTKDVQNLRDDLSEDEAREILDLCSGELEDISIERGWNILEGAVDER